jgi:serine phosphatase RsbU (regulator of sigma subunit)
MDGRTAVSNEQAPAESNGMTRTRTIARAQQRAQQTAASVVPAPPPGPHRLFLGLLPFAVAAVVAAVDLLAGTGEGFLPVLSVAPALAAISWPPVPTAVMGTLALAIGALLAAYDGVFATQRGAISLCAIAGVTVAGVIASAGRRRRERELADMRAVAEAAQQILLRPVPSRIPPVDIAVRYVSAAASARIGGDLYEAVAAGGRVRLIVGDVLGKGLAAARTASVVLGAFREAAYESSDLPQIAARIEASLLHQGAAEEFVTAVLAQVSDDGSQVEILSCGHPPPLVVHDGEITAVELPQAGLPLGLESLAASPREVCVVPFCPGDRMLFYTDGISEARDTQGDFYPLERCGALVQPKDPGAVLDLLIGDVLQHVGHSLLDDAAMLLISR